MIGRTKASLQRCWSASAARRRRRRPGWPDHAWAPPCCPTWTVRYGGRLVMCWLPWNTTSLQQARRGGGHRLAGLVLVVVVASRCTAVQGGGSAGQASGAAPHTPSTPAPRSPPPAAQPATHPPPVFGAHLPSVALRFSRSALRPRATPSLRWLTSMLMLHTSLLSSWSSCNKGNGSILLA